MCKTGKASHIRSHKINSWCLHEQPRHVHRAIHLSACHLSVFFLKRISTMWCWVHYILYICCDYVYTFKLWARARFTGLNGVHTWFYDQLLESHYLYQYHSWTSYNVALCPRFLEWVPLTIAGSATFYIQEMKHCCQSFTHCEITSVGHPMSPVIIAWQNKHSPMRLVQEIYFDLFVSPTNVSVGDGCYALLLLPTSG